MITQYTDTYGSISSDIQNLVSNRVGLLDNYILMQTGQYEYTALIKDGATKKVTKLVISRSSSYNNYYTVAESVSDDFTYTVSNEYYCYSNMHFGKSLSCPIYDQVASYGICILTCVVAFMVLFKGVLFRCLKRH